MDRTIVVIIGDHVKHPMVGKIVKKTVKLKTHDGKDGYTIGDIVRVMKTGSLPRDRRRRLVEIIGKAR